MELRHKEIVIDEENPFTNCKLLRQKYAKILTNIVSSYADGFVLAINNEWGTGKTTFVKMWQQQLTNEGFQNLYFNAWENDFDANPLVALMAELKTLIRPETKKEYKSLLEKGAVITKSVLPHVLKSIATKYMGEEAVGELFENTAKGITEIFEDEVKEYTTKKEGLKEFKLSLSKFVQALKGDKPLIFIVDELDRCRPNYAVELLEQIKHFFSIEGIVFVLSIDKNQLGHAVRGVYGNDRINADEYLRRFIDLEYALPNPDTKLFCNYLYEYFSFQDFFTPQRINNYRSFKNEKENFLDITSILFEKSNLTLRQQEKIFAHARLGLNSFKENHYVFPELYVILVFVRNFHPNYYSQIRLKQLTLEELLSGLHEIVPKGLSSDDTRYFIYIEALLVYTYYYYFKDYRIKKLIDKNAETGLDEPIVQSSFDKINNNSTFIQFLNSMIDECSNVSIEHLLRKIDLIEDVIK